MVTVDYPLSPQEAAKDSHVDVDQAAKAISAQMMKDKPMPTGWYRVNATRLITGGYRLKPKSNKAFDDVSPLFS